LPPLPTPFDESLSSPIHIDSQSHSFMLISIHSIRQTLIVIAI